MQWEYRAIKIKAAFTGQGIDESRLADRLNEEGLEGWEAILVQEQGRFLRVLMKRPRAETAPPEKEQEEPDKEQEKKPLPAFLQKQAT